MRIESKRMKLGMKHWYQPKLIRETNYYEIINVPVGGKVITLLPDEDGRVIRIVLTKHDIERINGAEAIEPMKTKPRKAPKTVELVDDKIALLSNHHDVI